MQSQLGKIATNYLNSSFNTKISVERLWITPLANANLANILIADHKNDTLIYAREINTSLKNIKKLINGDLYFGDIYGDDLRLNMRVYKGDTLSNLDVFVESFDDGSPSSGVPFIMQASGIFLKNSHFSYYDYNDPNPAKVDIDHITTDVSHFNIYDTNVSLKANGLSLLLDKHLFVKNLITDFCYSHDIITATQTELITDDSHLNFDLSFESNNQSYSNFLDAVKAYAYFRASKLSTNDLLGFYNGFGKNKNIYIHQGEAYGAINNLYAKKLRANYQNSIVKGDFFFANLLHDDAPIVVKGNVEQFQSIYGDLTGLLPHSLGENLPKIIKNWGVFNLKGNFTYANTGLSFDIDSQSSIGNFTANCTFFDIENLKKSTYKGNITANNFNIGALIENKNFKTFSGRASISGKSLDLQNLQNIEFDADIEQVEFQNYSYKNIKASALLLNQKLDGSASINDPNLKLSLNGLAKVAGQNSIFNFITDVQHANLKALSVVKNDSIAQLKGIVNIDLKGNSVENIIGKIEIKNGEYNKNDNIYHFEDFFIESRIDQNNKKLIQIESPDIISGKVEGVFEIAQIGKIFQNAVSDMFSNYQPFEVSLGQYLNFDFKIYNKIIEIFIPEITFAKNTFIKGQLISDENDFKLNFQSPYINLYNSSLQNINVVYDTKNTNFKASVNVNKIQNNIYNLSNLKLINTAAQDTLFFKTTFKGGTKSNDDFSFNFYHTINEQQQSVVGVKESAIVFKENKWKFDNTKYPNRVVFEKHLDSIDIQSFNLKNKEQNIFIGGKIKKENYKNLHLIFNKINLAELSPDIENITLNGVLNGNLSLLEQDKKYIPTANLKIQQFEFNNYPLGNFYTTIMGDEALRNFNLKTLINNNLGEEFLLEGNISNKRNSTELNLLSTLKNFNLKPFAPLIENVFSNFRGNLSGQTRIFGNIDAPKFDGVILLNNAGLGVPYLNIHANIEPQSVITLKNNDIIFAKTLLTETAYQTQATLSGKMYHKGLTNWFLDLSLQTQGERFLALNTQATDNDLFYGTGFVSGKANFKGSFDEIVIEVLASSERGTKFKIPLSDTQTVGDDSFVIFSEKKSEAVEVLSTKTYSGLEMKFDFDILPSAEVEIIIDPKTGSNLVGRGAGTILMEINTGGKFNMWGDYIVTTGEYNFNYEGLISKKFKVLPGGSIIWNGDPMRANLEGLKASYSLYANPSILLENSQFNRKINTQVIINLEGNLTQPQTFFDIKFPDANTSLVTELNYRLEDTDKKQLQAFSLLAQGNFLSDTSAGEKVLSHNILETATGLFNQLLSDEDDKLNLGISYENGTTDPNQMRTGDRLGITITTQISPRIFFNGKIGIPIGGITQTAVAGDFELQFLLNEEGTLSAKIFNRENELQQYLTNNIDYTQGIGLSYKVDFNTFKELISKLSKSKHKKLE